MNELYRVAMSPPAIPSDDLVAKCSPRGWGSVVWTSFLARYAGTLARGVAEAPVKAGTYPMGYKMEHHSSTKRWYRTIDEIVITNLYCGVGKGWDIIVLGEIIDHRATKTEAQCEAEKLLDGMR